MKILCLTLLLPLCVQLPAGEPSIERVDEKLAVFLVREAMIKRFPEADKWEVCVSKRGSGQYFYYTVKFLNPLPNGFWCAQHEPEANVQPDGRVNIDIWSDDDAGSQLPRPQIIAQRFLIPPKGAPKEPDRAITLIQRWLDVYRDRDEIDFVYDRLSWAYREAGKDQQLIDFLNREREIAKNPRAKYCILEELARAFEKQGKVSSAAEVWELAREAVKSGDHPWFSTRRDLPSFELGMLYFRANECENAKKHFIKYIASEYGRNNCRDACLKLGDIYELEGNIDAAEKLYRDFVAKSFEDFISARYREEIKEPFRQRLNLIEARRRMNSQSNK